MKLPVMMIFGFWTFSVGMINSQDLYSHQWKDRLLLIFDSDQGSIRAQSQIEELLSDQEGLAERKIVVYQITPDFCRLPLEDEKWYPRDKLKSETKWNLSKFEIILMGLDGNIKLQRQEIVSLDELFGIIDSMPMRMHEMKKAE
ncbi:MAG: DUF4174 domain-containing protein [Saprospiraceae bacterium]|nr:DUF4174 domain-containing protein [Saprospiraceae bacterium]